MDNFLLVQSTDDVDEFVHPYLDDFHWDNGGRAELFESLEGFRQGAAGDVLEDVVQEGLVLKRRLQRHDVLVFDDGWARVDAHLFLDHLAQRLRMQNATLLHNLDRHILAAVRTYCLVDLAKTTFAE